MTKTEEAAQVHATLLTVTKMLAQYKDVYPEAIKVLINRLMDITSDRCVWALQIVKMEARIDQHRMDCPACKSQDIHCFIMDDLQRRLTLYQEREVRGEPLPDDFYF
jgi:hypothetical protein